MRFPLASPDHLQNARRVELLPNVSIDRGRRTPGHVLVPILGTKAIDTASQHVASIKPIISSSICVPSSTGSATREVFVGTTQIPLIATSVVVPCRHSIKSVLAPIDIAPMPMSGFSVRSSPEIICLALSAGMLVPWHFDETVGFSVEAPGAVPTRPCLVLMTNMVVI